MTAVGVAFGAMSPLGEGPLALPVLEPGARARVAVGPDEALVAAGLTRSAAGRVPGLGAGDDAADRLLLGALSACVDRLDRVVPRWKHLRLGLALGTSSGGMPAFEAAMACLSRGEPLPSDLASRAYYGSPFEAATRRLPALARQAHVLGACASSTIALGLAELWLEQGACDVVLAGGYEALTTFVASGFAALGASTASGRPSPFRLGRDGLAPGEGAAVVAMVPAGSTPPDAPIFLCVGGFGAASDAAHITAPDREGSGVIAAARAALARAGEREEAIELVSAHGTATVFNDAAEARALSALFGPRAASLPVHAMKGEVGHLFGAAGALEALAAHQAMAQGITPASAGLGPVDPAAQAGVVDACEARPAALSLKLSLAFGGLNAALVLRREPAPSPARPAFEVELAQAIGEADPGRSLAALAATLGVSPDRLARTDLLTRLALDAVAELAANVGRDVVSRSGLVIGHDLACVATNALHARRVIEKGARAAEPRRFPYTSPNACAGEISIAFAMRGPTLAVGGAPGLERQALEVAADLCSSGLSPSVVVVEVSERSDAGDALLSAAGRPAPGPSRAIARLLCRAPR